MPFYILLTIFRVLSMGLIITAFSYYSIIIYFFLYLGIIIIGYMMTGREGKGKKFLTRGFRSSLTTGSYQVEGERLRTYIVTRGGVYNEILPEPEGNPEGKARGISRGLSQYFIVYPDSSHNTVILNYLY